MEKTVSLIPIIPAAVLALILLTGIITGFLITRKSAVQGDFDYLIVLGTTVNGEEPSVMLGDRIHAAYDILCQNRKLICIVSGGKGSSENLSEAACMYNKLTAMGIDPERIWLEEQATSTIENLRFSQDLIEEKTGVRSPRMGVLSNDFHMYRTGMLARRMGLSIVPIGAPSTRCIYFYQAFLREILTVWYYSLFR